MIIKHCLLFNDHCSLITAIILDKLKNLLIYLKYNKEHFLKEKFYITTAIDYSNGPPHLGHAYEKITADAIARYQRLLGKDVFFLTGLDEHGSKIEKASVEKGVTPQEHVDEIAAKYKDVWQSLNISYDGFIRTTVEDHKKAVEKIFIKLQQQGDVYKKSYQGLYCSGCEAFYLEKDLDANGNCPDHQRPPELVSEENYFFKITKYKERIKEHILQNPDFIQPVTRKNEIIKMLEEFEDISVSRETVKWGVKVPGDDSQVIYVWLDALNNYITALGYDGADDTLFKKYWPADLQVVGKDIMKFHCIIWPATLLALGLDLPKGIFGHGFLTIGGAKISKSVGNVINPQDLIDKYQADGLRYFIIREVNYGSDGDFSAEFKEDKSFDRCEIMENRVNADLANSLGNSLNRIVSSILAKNCDGIVPERNTEAEKDFPEFVETIKVKVAEAMDKYALQESVIIIWDLVNKLNKYIDTEAPWNLAKQAKEDNAAAPYFHGVLYTCLETLRIISLLASPFIPVISGKIWKQLGISDKLEDQDWTKVKWGLLAPGTVTNKSELIYPRVDSKLADKTKKNAT
jgi:methionyl-tRNA synthetase